MKKVFSIMFIVLLIGYAYAETIRQGDVRFSFNPSNIVAKTAAYTVTASDSLVKVTCSTAAVVVTLPTVASTRPGVKSYKILKTDATKFAVVVTPATGDTIGGESTRYLVHQNDYVVFSTGNGNDWQVAFESPLIKEDYEIGTVTFNKRSNVLPVNTTSTLSATACGSVITMSSVSSSVPITLPALTSGCDLTFVKATSTAKYLFSVATPSTANTIYGSSVSASSSNYIAAADTITFTSSTSLLGDGIKVFSDGTNWYASGMHASPTGIIYSQFD